MKPDYLDFLHTDHSWHGVNDEGDSGKGYWVRPGRVKELIAEHELLVVPEKDWRALVVHIREHIAAQPHPRELVEAYRRLSATEDS